MKHKQLGAASKVEVLEFAAMWVREKRPPFVVAEEFAGFVGRSTGSEAVLDELLAVVLDCGFPCVRGDNGERVLWLRPTNKGELAQSFAPTEIVRQFVDAATSGASAV
jgi:hypothetical protein